MKSGDGVVSMTSHLGNGGGGISVCTSPRMLVYINAVSYQYMVTRLVPNWVRLAPKWDKYGTF